jgi:hypothetical protein
MRLWCAVSLAGSLAGCFLGGSESTPFPPGLEPIGENTAPLPAPVDGDDYPEAIEIVHGEIDGVIFVHARGYIKSTPAKVWAALMVPDVVANRRSTDAHVASFDVEPDYDFSMLLSYTVERVVTIEWDETWRYGAVDGSFEAPAHGALSFQKTFGTTFIALLEGSIEVREIDGADQVTEYGFMQNLDTIMTESAEQAQYPLDLHEDIKAHVAGLPLPEY